MSVFTCLLFGGGQLCWIVSGSPDVSLHFSRFMRLPAPTVCLPLRSLIWLAVPAIQISLFMCHVHVSPSVPSGVRLLGYLALRVSLFSSSQSFGSLWLVASGSSDVSLDLSPAM